uniref:CSON005274 protein n=1 Tax=Culicoides sonorensis TaxID=179676 RepID=A0A336MVA4_CULSO
MKLIIDDRMPGGTSVSLSNKLWDLENADLVVNVKHAYKSYGSGENRIIVLDNLSMNVPKGVIYTLIGASGCGKTTLLSAIIARRKLDAGVIKVFGESPGKPGSQVPGPRVGFMPQETALYNQFTVEETLHYYGALNGIAKDVLEEKIPFFMALMQLTDSTQYASTLSGGQQRRLSLAATLIHDPEILILDEPTVGIDPLLREKIWDYLSNLCLSKHRTIIISTHYIEEAQKADCVAMMRKGVLIAEADRAYLQEKHDEYSLERIFLNLAKDQDCAKQLMYSSSQNSPTLPEKEKPKKEKVPLKKQVKHMVNMNHVNVLLKRNFLFILRSLGVMGMILAGYTAIVLCFCLAIGGVPSNLGVAVANYEISEIDRMAGFCPVVSTNCSYELLSCRYLSKLQPRVNLIYVQDAEAAYEQVRLGNAWVAMVFTSNYSLSYETKLNDQGYSDDWTIENSDINTRWDGTCLPLFNMLKKKLLDSYFEFTGELSAECGTSPRIDSVPIKFHDPVYGTKKHNFRDFPAPGFILTNIFFFAVASAASALIADKATNCMERSFANGITELENLISHFLPQLALVTFQTSMILFFGFKVFGLTINGPLGLVGILMLLSGVCGISFGCFIAYSCPNERSSYYIAAGSFISALLTSDIIWTSHGAHPYMTYILEFLPFLKAVRAMRSLLYKGSGLDDPTVLFGFLHIILWITAFLSLILIIIRVRGN